MKKKRTIACSCCLYAYLFKRNSTARIQYLKKRNEKKRQGVFMCAQKRNRTIWRIQKENFKTCFSVRIKETKDNLSKEFFFTYINKKRDKNKTRIFNVFCFLYNAIKKKKEIVYICVHKQQ